VESIEDDYIEQDKKNDEQDILKIEKIESEKRELLNRVVSGNIQNIKDRVAFILNKIPDTRNSDIELAWQYWKNFESEKFNGVFITREQLNVLARLSSLCRVRAKIQNEYKLFQADEAVKQFRGVLEKDKKQEAIEDKPSGLGTYTVYVDETGKTQDFLSVGSLWVLEGGYSSYLVSEGLRKWKNDRKINFEFHFSNLNKLYYEYYKEFFTEFLSKNPSIGFKIMVVNNKGFSDINIAITDLTYHLLYRGIIDENNTGRASLPRVLQVLVDEEEAGSDKIKLENLKERITRQNISGLYLDEFFSVSSHNNFFIQAVDLFTGAINRKLHFPSGTNIKDALADFILFECLDFDINSIDKNNNDIDQAKIFNLTMKDK